jgi:hypothetical protein
MQYRDDQTFRSTLPLNEVVRQAEAVLAEHEIPHECYTVYLLDGRARIQVDERYTKKAVAALERAFYKAEDDPRISALQKEVAKTQRAVRRLERQVGDGET